MARPGEQFSGGIEQSPVYMEKTMAEIVHYKMRPNRMGVGGLTAVVTKISFKLVSTILTDHLFLFSSFLFGFWFWRIIQKFIDFVRPLKTIAYIKLKKLLAVLQVNLRVGIVIKRVEAGGCSGIKPL